MEQDKDETPAPDYMKGFNDGYLMARHLPELAQELSKAVGDTSRGVGFLHGREQCLFEQTREKLPEYLRLQSEEKQPGRNHLAAPDKEDERDQELDR